MLGSWVVRRTPQPWLLLLPCLLSCRSGFQARPDAGPDDIDDASPAFWSAEVLLGGKRLAVELDLALPTGVVTDLSGNIFIADSDNHQVLRVDAHSQVVTTVAGSGVQGDSGDGGPATSAELNFPIGLTIDGLGNLFIADRNSHRVRKVDASTGHISTLAGTGKIGAPSDGVPAISTPLSYPNALAIDGLGNLFIADSIANRVRRVDAETGLISTVAGSGVQGYAGDGGPAIDAALYVVSGLAIDEQGNLFIADTNNHCIRRVDASSGIISTIAGTGTPGYSGDGGLATEAAIGSPRALTLDSDGALLVADFGNHSIRRIDTQTGLITTLVGTGLSGPRGLTNSPTGEILISDSYNHQVRSVVPETGALQLVAGTGIRGFSGSQNRASSAVLLNPRSIDADANGHLYTLDSIHRAYRVDTSSSVVTAVAGDGLAGYDENRTLAVRTHLNHPRGLSSDAVGNLYLADTQNHRIRRVDAATGLISTIAGSGFAGTAGDGGPATQATLNFPRVARVSGDHVLISDASYRLRRVDMSTGVIDTIAGTTSGYTGDGGPATDAQLGTTDGVAVDGQGNIYLADSRHHVIRKIDSSSGIISTVAGTGSLGFSGDGGSATSAHGRSPGLLPADLSEFGIDLAQAVHAPRGLAVSDEDEFHGGEATLFRGPPGYQQDRASPRKKNQGRLNGGPGSGLDGR